MTNSNVDPTCERTIEAMIELGHCSKRQRIIVSGQTGSQLMFELHRRGYHRVATTATSGLPQGQYDAALVDWGDQSLKSLETTLNWLVHFLDEPAVLVIRLESRGRGVNRRLQSIRFAFPCAAHAYGSSHCRERLTYLPPRARHWAA